MRVTNEVVVANSVRRLSARMAQYEQAQSRMATGKRIMRPSDDPSAANRALSLRATAKTREQEARNARDGLSWLETADTQLQSAMERVQRVRELTIQGLNPLPQDAKDAIAEEVSSIREELLSIANAKMRGRYLFAGHRDEPAVVADAGNWYYRDSAEPLPDPAEVLERRVGDDDWVRVNVTAAEAFFADQGDSLFSTVQGIEQALRDDDQGDLSAGLVALDEAKDRLGTQLAAVGAQTNWLESALRRSDDSLFLTQLELAETEDADYAEAVMDLQLQDVALQSTLQAIARALPPSLASFLR